MERPQQAQRTLPELRKADYVEGWVIWASRGGAYYGHAWLELDGRIIDPTLILSPWWAGDYEVFVPSVWYTHKEALHLRKTVFPLFPPPKTVIPCSLSV